MRNKDRGLPRFTILERYMRGDEEIKKLYDFSSNKTYAYSKHIETKEFSFTSQKLIKPDSISFDFGQKWNFEKLIIAKEFEQDWQKDIVDFGESIFIPYTFITPFCDNIEFTYNDGRKDCDCDKIFEPNTIGLLKKDFVDEFVTFKTVDLKDNLGFDFYNMWVREKMFGDNSNKEVDTLICDYWKLLI